MGGANLGILGSPEAFLVEHVFMIGIGTWGLLEVIKQGKRQEKLVSHEYVASALTKMRDDVTAVLAEHQDRQEKAHEHLTERVDELWERRKVR